MRAASLLLPVFLWIAAFAFTCSEVVLHNDHFGRISPGRQIARYGELPFRDFFDPGYFLTELSSAAVQLLFGDRLLGEVVLNAGFIATGAVVVFLLCSRISGSLVVGVSGALLAVLAMPRAYDYDKFLFYPLGILLLWRYLDVRTARALVPAAAGLVGAALYRYDNGVYVGASVLAGMIALHAGSWQLLARRILLLGMFAGLIALPAAIFIHATAGLPNAFDQATTYAIREGGRTSAFVVDPPPAHNVILVRWAASVDDASREQFAAGHGLRDGEPSGVPEERTWSYVVSDPSPDRLRAIVADPRIEDTHLIDRDRFTLMPEPFRTRVTRAIPLLRVHPRADLFENPAAGVVYVAFITMPLLAVVMLIGLRWRGVPSDEVERALVWSVVVMCVLLAAFVLRAPVAARVGGVAGPTVVLGAWLWRRVWRARSWWPLQLTLRVATLVGLGVVLWNMSIAAQWNQHITMETLRLTRFRNNLVSLAGSVPESEKMGGAHISGLAGYLRDCTAPTDRVFTSWFVPELYFFSQRAFAGRIAVTFGGHWSEERFQRRSVEALASQSVPIIVLDAGGASDFSDRYRLIDAYLQQHYRVAGESSFRAGEPEGSAYRVLVRRDRFVRRTHPGWSMPCFA